MFLIDKPIVGFDNGITITFRFPLTDKDSLQPVFDAIESFSEGSEYTLSFAKVKKRRSLDANAYMWVLCDEIAKVIRSTKEEVYRRAIKHVGEFSDVAVRAGEPCAELIKSWTSNGIGWTVELFDTQLVDNEGGKMKRVRLYKGSHRYSQASMSRLIDWLVDECKSLGIATMSGDKIKELEEQWQG